MINSLIVFAIYGSVVATGTACLIFGKVSNDLTLVLLGTVIVILGLIGLVGSIDD